MKIENQAIKQIGASGQISLGKEFAGRTVLINNPEPGVWLIKTAQTIPDSELLLHQPVIQLDLNKNGLNQQAFFANDVVLDAVLRNLELLGEASKQITAEVRQLNLQVSASTLQRLISCQSRLTPDRNLRR